jgi:hypothetical protein
MSCYEWFAKVVRESGKGKMIVPNEHIVGPEDPAAPRFELLVCGDDTISFNPRRARVSQINGRWKVADGDNWLLDFGSGGTAGSEAQAALSLIQHYGLSRIGYVGRPNPSMTYWLVGDQAPAGAFKGEDTLSFNPSNLQVRRISGRWKIVDGEQYLLDFANSQEEAQCALKIIRKYGFTRIGFVGRPNPSMTYFRR